jgi:hypothetical protein
VTEFVDLIFAVFQISDGFSTNVYEPHHHNSSQNNDQHRLPRSERRNAMVTILAVLTAALGFTAWCFFVDLPEYGYSQNFCRVMCRMYARNVKLALKVVAGLFLYLFVLCLCFKGSKPRPNVNPNGGGPESEQFFRFANTVTAPFQWLVEGLVFIARVFGLAFLIVNLFLINWFANWIATNPESQTNFAWKTDHCMLLAVAIAGLYLWWLWSTARRIIRDEYMRGEYSIGRGGSAAYALAVCIAWFAFVVVTCALGWYCMAASYGYVDGIWRLPLLALYFGSLTCVAFLSNRILLSKLPAQQRDELLRKPLR